MLDSFNALATIIRNGEMEKCYAQPTGAQYL